MLKENTARLAWISDSQRVAKHLVGLQDSPNELQRFPNVLRDNAIVEAFRYVSYCRQSIISAITASCLEVEPRFVQALIKKVIEYALRESPENLGLRKPVKSLEEKIDSAMLGTEFPRSKSGKWDKSSWHGLVEWLKRCHHGTEPWSQSLGRCL